METACHNPAGTAAGGEISDPVRLCRDPLVSVVMITYNHEQWLAKAIEGVLMQQTAFPVELVIGEDCSTDGTRAVALDYQRKHPETIRVLCPEKNKGALKNFLDSIKACRGKYVAFCEGDDYWITADKLQKQADLLDACPECSMCVAQTNVYDIRSGERKFLHTMRGLDKPRLAFEDFLRSHPVHTSTYLIRRNLLLEILERYENRIVLLDHSICLMLADIGPAVCMPEVVSDYQFTGVGIDSGQPLVEKRMLCEKIRTQFYLHYKKERRLQFAELLLHSHAYWAADYLFRQKQFRPAFHHVGKFLSFLFRHPRLAPSAARYLASLCFRTHRLLRH